jgi:hypothetical protein
MLLSPRECGRVSRECGLRAGKIVPLSLLDSDSFFPFQGFMGLFESGLIQGIHEAYGSLLPNLRVMIFTISSALVSKGLSVVSIMVYPFFLKSCRACSISSKISLGSV